MLVLVSHFLVSKYQNQIPLVLKQQQCCRAFFIVQDSCLVYRRRPLIPMRSAAFAFLASLAAWRVVLVAPAVVVGACGVLLGSAAAIIRSFIS